MVGAQAHKFFTSVRHEPIAHSLACQYSTQSGLPVLSRYGTLLCAGLTYQCQCMSVYLWVSSCHWKRKQGLVYHDVAEVASQKSGLKIEKSIFSNEELVLHIDLL